MIDIKENIKLLTEEKLQGTDYYVVDVKILPANKVQVFLDSDTVVTVDECAKISRHIEKTLDEKQWLGEKYILEVSSAGMDNPIKLERQYTKHIGKRIVAVTLAGVAIEGKIKKCDAGVVTITKEKQVKNNWVEEGEIALTLLEIKSAKRIINF